MNVDADAAGYAAVVNAAALVATSPIVDRDARATAQHFVMEEIDRWADHSAREDFGDPDEPDMPTDPSDEPTGAEVSSAAKY